MKIPALTALLLPFLVSLDCSGKCGGFHLVYIIRPKNGWLPSSPSLLGNNLLPSRRRHHQRTVHTVNESVDITKPSLISILYVRSEEMH
jgi:hypothetical protein